MRRKAPPLEAIEAFIVATRSRNFREAADSLALSPSALTRRIQTLETFLGASLFERTAGGNILSPVGESYRREVEPAIDGIRRATAAMRAPDASLPLRVLVPQSFALAWLVPHLSNWTDGAIRLRTGHDAQDIRNGHADIGILVGPVVEHGLHVEPLIDLEAELVSAHHLRDGRPAPSSLSQLANYPRVAVYRPRRIWETWLSANQYDGAPLAEPTRFESMFLAYEACAAGMGVTLGVRLLVDAYLQSGRLQPCLGRRAAIGFNYSLVFADASVARRSECARFVTWVRDHMSASKAQLSHS